MIKYLKSKRNQDLDSLCVIIVSDDTDDSLSNEKPVVVYGDFIEVYSCIAALLDLGLSGDTIAFIEPFPPEDIKTMRVNCFNNKTVSHVSYLICLNHS